MAMPYIVLCRYDEPGRETEFDEVGQFSDKDEALFFVDWYTEDFAKNEGLKFDDKTRRWTKDGVEVHLDVSAYESID